MDRRDGGPISPGKWSEPLIELAKGSKDATLQSGGHYGEEATKKVLLAVQDWVTKFTVSIGVLEPKGNGQELRDLRLGSGVVVRLRGDMHGVLTAAHVLNRKGNTPQATGATVLFPSMNPDRLMRNATISLKRRACTVVGFHNTSEEGPDIAIIPLTNSEWSIFNKAGMVAYNLDKERWSDADKAKIPAMRPWFLSVISGVRNRASQTVQGYRGEDTKSIVLTTTNTFVDVAAERDGYDYLELPSEVTEFSYPAHWRRELPGTAAEEIAKLNDEGVTDEVWGGTSGAGVWNLAIGTNEDGIPSGVVHGELAGICYYAHPEKGCMIAHGTTSIEKIASAHAEKEALRYHSKA